MEESTRVQIAQKVEDAKAQMKKEKDDTCKLLLEEFKCVFFFFFFLIVSFNERKTLLSIKAMAMLFSMISPHFSTFFFGGGQSCCFFKLLFWL